MNQYLKNILAITLAAVVTWGIVELSDQLHLHAQPIGTQGSVFIPAPGSGNAGYPPGSTPIGAAQSATTGGISLSFGGTPGQYTYLCNLVVSPGSAAAAITVPVSLGNTAAQPVWNLTAPVTGAGVTGTPLTDNSAPNCYRSNNVGQAITVTVGALGTSGVNQTASAGGYTQ